MYRCILGSDQLEGSLAKKDLGSHGGQQVEHEPEMCPCCKKASGILGCVRRSIASRSREVDPSSLLDTSGATPGVLSVTVSEFFLVRKIGHNCATVMALSIQSSMMLSSSSFYNCFCCLQEKYNHKPKI